MKNSEDMMKAADSELDQSDESVRVKLIDVVVELVLLYYCIALCKQLRDRDLFSFVVWALKQWFWRL